MKRIFCSLLLLAVCLLPAGCGGGGGNTPPPPPPPPQPSVAITAPTSGQTVSGTVTVSASCTNCAAGAQIQFNKDGTSNIGAPAAVAAGVASVSWNTMTIGNGSHTLTAALVGTLIVSPGVNVSVNNQQSQLPRIDSITPPWFGTQGPFGVINAFNVTGANFTNPFSLFLTDLKSCAPTFQDSTHFVACIIVDAPGYNPGAGAMTVQTAAGTSNTGHVVLVSLANNLRATATEFYLLDPGSGLFKVYNRATGAKVNEINGSGGIAFDLDNLTGSLLRTGGTGGIGVHKPDNTGGVVTDGQPVMEAAVRDGLVCASKHQNGRISTVDISSITVWDPPPGFDRHYDIGGQPFPVVRWKQGSTQFCGSVDVEGNRLIIVNLTAQTFFVSTINGLRKKSELLPFPDIQVGFKFATAEGASFLGYLHIPDRKLKLFDRVTGAETLTVDLPVPLGAVPTELAVNPADGTVVVALFDTATGLGRLVKVNSQTGNVTQLAQTVTFAIDCIFIEAGTAHVSNRGALPVPYNLN